MGPRSSSCSGSVIVSFASGRGFSGGHQAADADDRRRRALQEQASTLELVDIQIGLGPGQTMMRRISCIAIRKRAR